MSEAAPGVGIRKGYRSGAIGRVIELHGSYYGKYWNFGLLFETEAARELSACMNIYSEERDGLTFHMMAIPQS